MPDLRFSLAGFFVGLLVGQTGVGGGSLMTPLLVLLFGIHPATAVGTDLLYAALTKTVGTAAHGMHGTVNWRITGLLAAGSVPSTLLTLLLMTRFDTLGGGSARLLSVALGVALVLTAIALLARRHVLAFSARRMDALTPRHVAQLTVLVMLYRRLPLQTIVGSDIAHAVPLTLIAGAGHWLVGSVDFPLLGSLLVGSIPGIIIGTLMSVRMPDRVLRPILAVTLLMVGGKLIL